MWVIAAFGVWAPLASAQAVPGKTVAPGKLDAFADAQRVFKEGKFAKAAEQFAAFSKAKPTDPQAAAGFLQEGLCHLKLGQAGEAVRCWD